MLAGPRPNWSPASGSRAEATTPTAGLLQWDFLQQSSAPAIYPGIELGFGSFGRGSGIGVGTGLGAGLGGASAPRGCSVVFEVRDGTVQGFDRNGPDCVA